MRFEPAGTFLQDPNGESQPSFNGFKNAPIPPPMGVFLASDLILTSSHISRMPFTGARELVTANPR